MSAAQQATLAGQAAFAGHSNRGNSWQSVVGRSLVREAIRAAAPRAVMIVGKMVHGGIGGRIRALLGATVTVQWMYQPQARRPVAEHGAGIERLRGMVGAP